MIMWWLLAVALLLGMLSVLVLWLARERGCDCAADETHFATTEDGWRIALSRYRAVGGGRRYPVVLCHGLAANRASFDLAPECSLARHLATRGFDVWSLELRGHGCSDRPTWFGLRRWGWCFDDYLRKDIPAALALVRAETGAERVHFVGHSMGGILLYAHLGQGGERDIASGVAIGSSLDYSASHSEFHNFVPLAGVAGVLPFIPFGPLARLGAPLCGRFTNPVEKFNCCRSNVDPHLARRLYATAIHSCSTPVMVQLASAFHPGGLRSRDGTTAYLEALARVKVPVLALAGTSDLQCPPDAARATLDNLAAPGRRFVAFGRVHGQSNDYGHFDMIIGRRAADEVYPVITDFLEHNDRETKQPLKLVG
jgi:pimeloyl-ACP methyl ester carboxylesterase